MPFKSESSFRRHLIDELRVAGFEVQGIESGGTGRGIPDIYYSRTMQDTSKLGWIELKNILNELDDIVKIDFRAGQYEWLMRFCKAGTPVRLMVSCETGIFVFKNRGIKKSYTLADFLSYPHVEKIKHVSSLL